MPCCGAAVMPCCGYNNKAKGRALIELLGFVGLLGFIELLEVNSKLNVW